MKGTKILEWLHAFDADEIREFRKFVRSPYFNEHKAVIQLLDLLLSPCHDKASIWAEIFPGLPYDDLRLRHLSSLLLALCERFVAVQGLTANPTHMQVECLAFLRRKGTAKLKSFTAGKFQRQRNARKDLGSVNAFLHTYRFEAELQDAVQDDEQRSGTDVLTPVIGQLDNYYFLSKLKYACTQLNNARVVGKDTANVLILEIRHLLQQSDPFQPALLGLYNALFSMLSAPEDLQSYARFREMLDLLGPNLPDEEAADVYTFTMNHCIGRINAGQQHFLKALFGLYQTALQRGFLFQNTHLSPWNYKNITVTGLRLGEFEWVERFIHDYQQKLAPEHRANAFTYKNVTYHFASAANLKAFQATPDKYEPQYGGWCAYAMGANGEKVEIDPETFKILDGKLYLFYHSFINNTLPKWNKDEANLHRKADANWTKLVPAS